MCTKAEVREVMLETNAPTWMRVAIGVMVAGILGLLGWMLLSTHAQEGYIKDFRTEVITNILEMRTEVTKSVAEAKLTSVKNTATLTSKFAILSTELKNIKETSLARSSDRYTGTEARTINKGFDDRMDARSVLMDERCMSIRKEVEDIKDLIDKHHSK